ncbi:MAG: threonine synthase [Saprospiraceae bacterium]|nr:threonine synthase [Saprospiraceae bacterium]
MNTGSKLSHLACLSCGGEYDAHILINYCLHCSQPLVARYNLNNHEKRPVWSEMPRTGMWDWKVYLPVFKTENIFSLGEGMTEVRPLSGWAKSIGLSRPLLMKDESTNPTGSFKARGMSAAVSKAVELGVTHFCTPTAGNAGSALAAYAALAGTRASVFMPKQTPKMFSFDVALMDAEVYTVEGTIRDAGLLMAEKNKEWGAWDVSTLKEPYRLEGKKTMGYELAAQLNYKLPDVIFYPTGGGTGLIGIWKAFKEMQEMGWIDEITTRMVAVQMEGCAPIVKAWQNGAESSEVWDQPDETAANGLRVPKAFGDKLILTTLKESQGFAISVSELEMRSALKAFAVKEGHFVSPEGAACLAAIKKSKAEGKLDESWDIAFIQTGNGYKYAENLWA